MVRTRAHDYRGGKKFLGSKKNTQDSAVSGWVSEEILEEVQGRSVLGTSQEQTGAEEQQPPLAVSGAVATTGDEEKRDDITRGRVDFPAEVLERFLEVFVGDPKIPIRVAPQRLRTNGKRLPAQRRRNLNAERKAAALELVQEFVEHGWLRRAKADEGVRYAAPIHPVRKPGGGWRLTWDFRTLNQFLEPEWYPMPLPLRDLQARIRRCRRFGKIDLRRAYWQIAVDDESARLCAVVIDDEIFLPTRLAQGLSVSAQVCQRIMVGILRGDYDEGDENLLKNFDGVIIIYIDDVLLGAYSAEGLETMWLAVLTRFRKYGVRVNGDKSIYMAEQVPFVGRVISAEGIQSGLTLTSGLDQLKVPRTEQELADFVYGWGFFREFLPGYTLVMSAAQTLLTEIHRKHGTAKKNKLLHRRSWDDATHAELQTVVDNLRELAGREIALSFPDPRKRYFILTDASDVGWAGIIGQCDQSEASWETLPLEQRHPELLGCVGGTWTAAQKNWSTNRQESHAVLTTLQSAPYLEDTLEPVYILCDNSSTVGLFQAAGEKRSQAKAAMRRMHEEAAMYNYVIAHIPGKLNLLADYVSRPHVVQDDAPDEAGVAPTPEPDPPPDVVPQDHASVSVVPPEPVTTIDDAEVDVAAVRARVRQLHAEFNHARTTSLTRRCVKAISTVNAVTVKRVVREEIDRCTVCQRHDRRTLLYYGEGTTDIYTKRGECLSLDLKTSKEAGFPFVLVVLDHFSNYTWVEALPSKHAKVCWQALMAIQTRMQIPITRLLSDNGLEFEGDFERHCLKAGITQLVCAPRAPWQNGKVERVMAEVNKTYLDAILEDENVTLPDLMETIEGRINNRLSVQLLDFTPLEVWHRDGDHDWTTIDLEITRQRRAAQTRRVRATLHLFHPFVAGNHVWVSKMYWSTRAGGATALAYARSPNWVGPFVITEVFAGGYSVTVERAYDWTAKRRRGRKLQLRYHMSIRYVKPLLCHDDDWETVRAWGSTWHTSFFP